MWLGTMGFGDGGLGRIRGRASFSAISYAQREIRMLRPLQKRPWLG